MPGPDDEDVDEEKVLALVDQMGDAIAEIEMIMGRPPTEIIENFLEEAKEQEARIMHEINEAEEAILTAAMEEDDAGTG